MKFNILFVSVLIGATAQASTVEESVPEPWFRNGQPPAMDACQAGVDAQMERHGRPNLTLRCEETEQGFVGIMQNFSAQNYLGKRVRFSALVKAEGIEGWGGLWMRVDDVGRPGSAFDNMQDRGIKGTSDWTPYSVVLDVSSNAQGIFFGTLMNGAGQLWVTSVNFEIVDDRVPTTGRKFATEPGNLELAR